MTKLILFSFLFFFVLARYRLSITKYVSKYGKKHEKVLTFEKENKILSTLSEAPFPWLIHIKKK